MDQLWDSLENPAKDGPGMADNTLQNLRTLKKMLDTTGPSYDSLKDNLTLVAEDIELLISITSMLCEKVRKTKIAFQGLDDIGKEAFRTAVKQTWKVPQL